MSSALSNIDLLNKVDEIELLGDDKQSLVSKSSGLLFSNNNDISLLLHESVIASSRLLVLFLLVLLSLTLL